jgi:hypothetical protein
MPATITPALVTAHYLADRGAGGLDDEGTQGYCLSLANGHRAVAVGERLVVRRDKPVSLHFTHCLQYVRVSNAARLNLAGNHF